MFFSSKTTCSYLVSTEAKGIGYALLFDVAASIYILKQPKLSDFWGRGALLQETASNQSLPVLCLQRIVMYPPKKIENEWPQASLEQFHHSNFGRLSNNKGIESSSLVVSTLPYTDKKGKKSLTRCAV